MFVLLIIGKNLSVYVSTSQPQSYIIQKYVYGKTIGVEILSYKGKIIEYFFHERVHQPLERGGGSSLRKSIAKIDQLYGYVEKFCDATHYTGVGMFEFQYDDARNAYLIEVNGRFWGSLPLSLAAEVDFPFHLYVMLTNQMDKISKSYYKSDVYCRNTSSDLDWWISNIKSRLF